MPIDLIDAHGFTFTIDRSNPESLSATNPYFPHESFSAGTPQELATTIAKYLDEMRQESPHLFEQAVQARVKAQSRG